MKAEIFNPKPEGFEPISVLLTIENEGELAFWTRLGMCAHKASHRVSIMNDLNTVVPGDLTLPALTDLNDDVKDCMFAVHEALVTT